MSLPSNIPKNLSFEKIEKTLIELSQNIKKNKKLNDKELTLFRNQIQSLSNGLKIDFKVEEFIDIDQKLLERIMNTLYFLETTGRSQMGSGNVQLSLFRVLDEVKSEIQNVKKRVVVERAGDAEMGGGTGSQ